LDRCVVRPRPRARRGAGVIGWSKRADGPSRQPRRKLVRQEIYLLAWSSAALAPKHNSPGTMGRRPHSAGAATALPGIVREALDDENAGGCDTLETAELIFCSRSANDLGDEFYQRADEGPPRNVGEGAANLFSTNPPSRLDGLRESHVSIDRCLTAGGAKVGIATLTSPVASNGGKRLSAYGPGTALVESPRSMRAIG
jgi:hypothetical protein